MGKTEQNCNHHNDAVHQLLDECCPYNSISEIWILFPDPWPKKRHFKRRLIDKLFFDKIHKYLKKGSTILDAGCGDQKYKKYCNHLKYSSQDFKKYSNDQKKSIRCYKGHECKL